MDWLDDTNQENVTIAVTKRPAIVDETDPSFGGTIFAQPGGPGASGTLYGLGRAKKYQQHFDKPGKKHYEILSIDPRGIGHSTPKIDCFPGILSYLRGLERITAGSLDLSPEALAFSVAAAKADGSQCKKVHGKFLSYVGTPNVARDMVAILDKIEELRQRNSHNGDDSRLELRSDAPEDLARLQYIGVSYGTTIGQFFASMFPGRVGRMILDGVTNAEEASNGLVSNVFPTLQRQWL
jgi:pimeloyl-ACP methyl ester carboxylesterase